MPLSSTILLALVQGLTEFLPVSSSGHLLAARYLFNMQTPDSVFFDAFLHLGTLCAVLIYFWRRWWQLLRHVGQSNEAGRQQRAFLGKLILATIPGALAGLWLENWFTLSTYLPWVLSVELVITAAILCIADYGWRVPRSLEPSYKDAFIIGLAQVVALFPGVSRSGTTIAAGQARGLSRHDATIFSFLMSAPIIAGAGLIGLREVVTHADLPLVQLLVGFLVAFGSGLLAIHWFLKVIERVSFTPFIVYLVLLAALIAYVG